MKNFFKNHGRKMIITTVIIILFIIFGVSVLSKEENLGKGSVIGDVIVPVQRLFRSVDVFISERIYRLTHISEIMAENERLEKEIGQLKKDIYRYESLLSNQETLKNSLKMIEEKKYDYLPALIVGKDTGLWFNRFNIDKGKAQGVTKDSMVVIGVKTKDNLYDASLIGRVIDVGQHWAKVISIVDKGSNVSIKILRTGAQGVIEGSEEEILNGFLFDKDTDVRVGDLVYTTAVGGHFQEGLYVGEVEDVQIEENNLLKTIQVKPKVDFKNLSRVYVIKKVTP